MALGKRAKARQAPQSKKSKGARRSGNPAKAAQQAAQEAAQEQAAAGSALGLGNAPDLSAFDPNDLPDLSQYLK